MASHVNVPQDSLAMSVRLSRIICVVTMVAVLRLADATKTTLRPSPLRESVDAMTDTQTTCTGQNGTTLTLLQVELETKNSDPYTQDQVCAEAEKTLCSLLAGQRTTRNHGM